MTNPEIFEKLKKEHLEKTATYFRHLEGCRFSELFDYTIESDLTSSRLAATVSGALLTHFIVTMKNPNQIYLPFPQTLSPNL